MLDSFEIYLMCLCHSDSTLIHYSMCLLWKLKSISSTSIVDVSGTFSLSILDEDQTKGSNVKHYRVRKIDTGGFYITARAQFDSLKKLIEHYQSELMM